MKRDLEHELDQAGERERPQLWDAQVGATCVGTLLGYDRVATRHGVRFVARVKEEQSGDTVGIPLFWKVLQERFKELRPQPGERFGVRRLSDSEKGYRRFTMIVDRDESTEPDFFSTSDEVHEPTASSKADIPF